MPDTTGPITEHGCARSADHGVTLPRPVIDAVLSSLRDEDPLRSQGLLEGALIACGYDRRFGGEVEPTQPGGDYASNQLRHAATQVDRVLEAMRAGKQSVAYEILVLLREHPNGALAEG